MRVINFLKINKFFAVGFFIVLSLGLLLTLRLTQQQQENRSKASAATTLSLQQDPQPAAPVAPGEATGVTLMVDPGVNFVSSVKTSISFDSTKFELVDVVVNTQSFPNVLENNKLDGAVSLSVSVGADVTKVIQTPTKVATLLLKAKNIEGSSPFTIDQSKSLVLSLRAEDDPAENVLQNVANTQITISSTAPTGTQKIAEMISPEDGLPVKNTQGFTWSPGNNALGYKLEIGTTKGGNNIISEDFDASTTTTKVTNLIQTPSAGYVYAKLTTKLASGNPFNEYVYIASQMELTCSNTLDLVAKWNPLTGATGYTLHVSNDQTISRDNKTEFVNYPPGIPSPYFKGPVGNVTTYSLGKGTAGSTYYAFVRSSTGINSNVEGVTCLAPTSTPTIPIGGGLTPTSTTTPTSRPTVTQPPSPTSTPIPTPIPQAHCGDPANRPDLCSCQEGSNQCQNVCSSDVPDNGYSTAHCCPANERYCPRSGKCVSSSSNCPTTGASITLSFSIPSIGNLSGNTTHPQHPTRSARVWIYNSNNELVKDVVGNFVFNGTIYKGTIHLGESITTGSYNVVLAANNTLRKRVTGIVSLTANTVNTVPGTVRLTSGDINQDNNLDLLDYNTIATTCYQEGPRLTKIKEDCAMHSLADLNDDGLVGDIDVNILQQGFAIRQGDDGGTPNPQPSPSPVATNQLEIRNNIFLPALATAKVGQSVTWTNRDTVVHTITEFNNQWTSQDLQPGESFTKTFTTPGVVSYTCKYHPNMKGMIAVTE